MSGVLTEVITFVKNFIQVTAPYVFSIGLVLGVVAFGLIGVKIITAKNGQDRAIVLDNFKWSVIGLILLGVLLSIFYFLIGPFFK